MWETPTDKEVQDARNRKHDYWMTIRGMRSREPNCQNMEQLLKCSSLPDPIEEFEKRAASLEKDQQLMIRDARVLLINTLTTEEQ